MKNEMRCLLKEDTSGGHCIFEGTTTYRTNKAVMKSTANLFINV